MTTDNLAILKPIQFEIGQNKAEFKSNQRNKRNGKRNKHFA